MGDTKRRLCLYSFYDRTGIERYLEKQAAKGWLLEKIDTWGWRFRQTEPKKAKFNVVYFPEADLYDPAPGEAELTFREFCEADGWILAASSAQMLVFYTEKPHPVPIETDPVMEVEHIHQSMKKGELLAFWLFLLSGLLQLLSQWLGFRESPLRYMSARITLYFLAVWLVLIPVAIARSGCYYHWLRRARRTAEKDGAFLPSGNFALAEWIISLLVLVSLVGVLATMENKGIAVAAVLSMVLVAIIVGLVQLFRNKLKEEGYEAKTAKLATVIACVVLGIAVYGIGGRLSAAIINGAQEEKMRDPAPLHLRLEDLLGYDSHEYDRLVLYNQESVFLAYQDSHQTTTEREPWIDLSMEVVDVKWDGLYELCLEEMMAVPKRIQGSHFEEIDPAPWAADTAYQLLDADIRGGWYVLCWGDRIAELVFSWEPTAEQMQTVGEKLG